MRYSKKSERDSLLELYKTHVSICKGKHNTPLDTTEIFVCTIDEKDCGIEIRGRGCWFKNKDDVSQKNPDCPYNSITIKKRLITVSEALNEKESEW